MKEFLSKYDDMVAKHGDPMEKLFEILQSEYIDSVARVEAAKTLLKYRYVNRQVLELSVDDEILDKI